MVKRTGFGGWSCGYPRSWVRGRSVISGGMLTAAAAAALLGGCAGASEENAGERHGNFQVQVTSSFPTHQRLAQQTDMVVSVKNTGHATMPDVAVTVTDPKYGDAAQSFGVLIPENAAGQPILASRSRAVWIINQAPGLCGFSCKSRGPGGAATAYTDTWALGALRPGHTATFKWLLTAIQAGTYRVRYQVAAGLNGYAKAVTVRDRPVSGSYLVTISSAPANTYVESDGAVVSSPRAGEQRRCESASGCRK